jgi:hypothetical protein
MMQMDVVRGLALSCSLAAVGLAACGNLTDPESAPSLTTVNGTLTGTIPLAAGASAGSTALRVALVWNAGDAMSGAVAVDLPVTPEFPASFVLDLQDPPPESALVALGGGDAGAAQGRYASGLVVAYQDLNGNGRLDFVGPEAASFVDRVVGANDELVVTYFEGGVPDADAGFGPGQATLGYNLWVPPRDCSAVAYDAFLVEASGAVVTPVPQASCTSQPGSFRPVSEGYPLTLQLDPRFDVLACAQTSAIMGGGVAALVHVSQEDEARLARTAPGDAGSDGPPASTATSLTPTTLPPPANAALECTADGRAYRRGCTPASLCGPSTYVPTAEQNSFTGFDRFFDDGCDVYQLADDAPVPAGWPCAAAATVSP